MHKVFSQSYSIHRVTTYTSSGPEKLVAQTLEQVYFHVGLVLIADHLVRASAFLRWKFAKYVCAHVWWVSQLKYFFLLCTYTYNAWCKAGCECQLCLKLRFHICCMRMWHCSIHVFQTPPLPSYLFFLESLSGHSNWMVESRILQPGLLNSRFNRPFCRTYRITLIHLHVFHFLSD